MNVLIACEESQRVCEAFRNKGHNAFSCDILKPSGNHLEWHIQDDVSKILNPNPTIKFVTMTHDIYEIPKWDLIIAHPPCTYLTISGNRWFNVDKYGDKARERIKLREQAYKFFMEFVNADCEKIAIENPIGYMNTHYRKPDQMIQPYYFAESENSEDNQTKKTCLWLKGLSKLTYNIKYEPKSIILSNGKKDPPWHYETLKISNKEERSRLRSQTFLGIAKAMAEQWG